MQIFSPGTACCKRISERPAVGQISDWHLFPWFVATIPYPYESIDMKSQKRYRYECFDAFISFVRDLEKVIYFF